MKLITLKFSSSFLVFITMGCANLAYLTRNPFRFFECFPNFSRIFRAFSDFLRNLLEFLQKFFECFPSFPEIFRAFSDFFEYFSNSLPKFSINFRNPFSTCGSRDLCPFPNRALRLSHL